MHSSALNNNLIVESYLWQLYDVSLSKEKNLERQNFYTTYHKF